MHFCIQVNYSNIDRLENLIFITNLIIVLSFANKIGIIFALVRSFSCLFHYQSLIYISLNTQSSFWLYTSDGQLICLVFLKTYMSHKNPRQSITFQDYMIKLFPTTLTIPLSSSKLCLVHLSSSIFHGMIDSFFIHSSLLQYERFLVIDFISGLVKNLSILYLIIFESAK